MTGRTPALGGLLFELFEHVLIAFVLSGVAWNVAAGHGIVPSGVVPVGIVLTVVLLSSLLAFETVDDFTIAH